MAGDRDEKGRFPPKTSGNPGGWSRQLEKRWLELIKEARADYGEHKDISVLDLMFWRMVDAIKSDDHKAATAATKVLGERIDGLPKAKVDVGAEASPELLALLAALRMTPHERRQYVSEHEADDQKALDAALAKDDSDD